jgi:hypothetical protein
MAAAAATEGRAGPPGAISGAANTLVKYVLPEKFKICCESTAMWKLMEQPDNIATKILCFKKKIYEVCIFWISLIIL